MDTSEEEDFSLILLTEKTKGFMKANISMS